MELDIFEALSDGFERTIQKNGLMLAGLYFVLGLITTSSSQTVISEYANLAATAAPSTTGTLALPIPGAAAAVLMITSYLLSILLSIVAIRTLVSDATETIPSEFYSRNMPMAALNIIIGGLAYGLIVVAGLIALIIPGIFLLVALYFWNVFVAVEDDNFIDALKNSWSLTDGNRLRLFALGFTVVVATGVFSSILGFPSMLGLPLVGSILSQIGGALTGVFTIATTAQAYNQLK